MLIGASPVAILSPFGGLGVNADRLREDASAFMTTHQRRPESCVEGTVVAALKLAASRGAARAKAGKLEGGRARSIEPGPDDVAV